MWHHQDQYASGFCGIRFGDLWAEYCDVWKLKTRRIAQDDEELQDWNQRDRNYNHRLKIQLPLYPTTRIIHTRIQQSSNPMNEHDKLPSNIHQGRFTRLFSPINVLTKQKRAMWRAMHKPKYLPMKIFSAQLTKLNNYLLLLTSSSASKKMASEERTKIILHAVTNVWAKKTIYRDGI